MLKMEPKSSVLLGLMFVFAIQAIANADGTLTFRDGTDGYAGTEDTYLESIVGDWNYGQLDEIHVINTVDGANVANSIIKFTDLSSLAGTTVTQAYKE